MRSSVFQYPYPKVFRRTADVLSQLGMKIISSDAVHGSIKARSGFSLKKPPMVVDLTFEEMENENTRVTIHGIAVKNLFFQQRRDVDSGEAEILEILSSIM
jgi:hypothetical protein